MANRLKMAEVTTIEALRAQGWSARRIARELDLHRDTVRRYLHLAEARSKPAHAPTGSGPPESAHAPHGPGAASAVDRSKPAIAPTGSPVAEGAELANAPTGSELLGEGMGAVLPPLHSGPISGCESYRAIIEGMLAGGLSAQRVYQDLVSAHGFIGSYYSVRRFVRKLGQAMPLPFRRMECAPGEEAQVDFGTGAPVIGPDGKWRKTHVFRIVLSHSRKAYSEAVYRQTTDDFIRCLENAFRHFGGIPRTLVIDNLKAAVSRADWFDPELNPKMLSFAGHYGTVILPTKPYTPRHKGKVERGVDYVQENALKGKRFENLQAQNEYLLEWETQVADTRIHGTTRQQVQKAFAERERPALLTLPLERFAFFHEGQRTVNRDGHVEVDKAYYSVPPEYLSRRVWVRWDGRLVRVFNARMEQIAVHAQHEPGRFSTDVKHIASRKVCGLEQGAARLLAKAALIGPQTARWAEAMVQQRGIEGLRVLMGLLALAKRYPCAQIERACQVATSHGAYRLRTLRELIGRQGQNQEQFEFIDEHPIIRSLAEYGQVVQRSITEKWA